MGFSQIILRTFYTRKINIGRNVLNCFLFLFFFALVIFSRSTRHNSSWSIYICTINAGMLIINFKIVSIFRRAPALLFLQLLLLLLLLSLLLFYVVIKWHNCYHSLIITTRRSYEMSARIHFINGEWFSVDLWCVIKKRETQSG